MSDYEKCKIIANEKWHVERKDVAGTQTCPKIEVSRHEIAGVALTSKTNSEVNPKHGRQNHQPKTRLLAY